MSAREEIVIWIRHQRRHTDVIQTSYGHQRRHTVKTSKKQPPTRKKGSRLFCLHPLSHRGFERGEARRTIEGSPRLLTPLPHPASSPHLFTRPLHLASQFRRRHYMRTAGTGDGACPEQAIWTKPLRSRLIWAYGKGRTWTH